MLKVIVMIRTDGRAIGEVSETIADIEGVSQVYSVTGEWDMVVFARARDSDSLSDLVTNGMRRIEGVAWTQTLLALDVWGKYDKEHMFSIGFPKHQPKTTTPQVA